MKKITRWCAAILLLAILIVPLFSVESYRGESIFENAKEFFDSADTGEHHTLVENGIFYIGTSGKLAASSTNLRYQSIGWDITLMSQDKKYSISFSVARGESLQNIEDAYRDVDGYSYNIFCVKTADLIRLAEAAGEKQGKSYDVEKVLADSKIKVYADAIMTTKKGTSIHGSVTEDGYGGVVEDGDVYHLNDKDDLDDMKDTFSGHTFKSFIDVTEELDNFTLTLQYYVGPDVTVSNGYGVSNGTITWSGKKYLPQYKLMQQFYLLNTNILNPLRTGYKLPPGNEWKLSSGYPLSISKPYMPKDIEPEVGYKNKSVVLQANWQPIEYSIEYYSDGGTGSVVSTPMFYDESKKLANNTFYKSGYYLEPGKEWIDKSTGKTYASGESVKNLTTKDGDKIKLYANWKQSIVPIEINKQGGIGGPDFIYEKYGSGFYTTEACLTAISKITKPTKTGNTFNGYWTGINGHGYQVTDKNGNILSTINKIAANKFFIKDSIIYADWEENVYTITLDNGGADIKAGTSAYYEKYSIANYSAKDCTNPMSSIVRPEKTGQNFMGYYTGENGSGTCYVDKNGNILSSSTTFTANTTLYAHWEPKVLNVTLDMQFGSGGTTGFFEHYGLGFYASYMDNILTNPISNITAPTRPGYVFDGYYTKENGGGVLVIPNQNTASSIIPIGLSNTYFLINTTLYAKWINGIYTITLDNQNATTAGTTAYYEKYAEGNYSNIGCTSPITSISIPQKTGNTFKGYYTGKNGSGECYVDKNGLIKSLSVTFTADTTLYADWEENIYEVVLDMQEGSGGTTGFYEKYGVNFYAEKDGDEVKTTISNITIPVREGYTFGGYYTLKNGAGEKVIDYNGSGTTTPIGKANTFFTKRTVLYAFWIPLGYEITFDKQGGTGGTDKAPINYGDSYPAASAPSKDGYSFKGYYTKANGQGELIYNENMVSGTKKYQHKSNTTLYAYWEDDLAPTVHLLTNYKTWTKNTVTLTASAYDNGTGLKSVLLYMLKDDGTAYETPVAGTSTLNGAKTYRFDFGNTKEGIIRYKAVAIDKNGNQAESYNVVYYDTKGPTGEIYDEYWDEDEDYFYIEIDITDINRGD